MEAEIKKLLTESSTSAFGCEIEARQIQFQKTRKDVEGDLTLVVFPFVKIMRAKPEEVGKKIGEFLKEKLPAIEKFNVVKGFLNLSFTENYWIDKLKTITNTPHFGQFSPSGKTFMVEYSSPNTNKPLHLGHVRNIFLGYSVAQILAANGHRVIKTQIVNDRGIHICKSMLAWKRFAPKDNNGNRDTPASSHMKGDHFVGKYYIEFDNQVTQQGFDLATDWHEKNEASLPISAEDKEKLATLFAVYNTCDEQKKRDKIYRKIAAFAIPYTELTIAAKEMLLNWENNDPEIRQLWSTMNGWVYAGFDKTYQRMGVDFDKVYYESDTFLIGKKVVAKELDKKVFYKKEDGSVWINIEEEGLDEKLVLRADGTAVYMTQDIGTAIERFKDFSNLNGIIYTVGDEQNYHFKVLFLILKKLGYEWADSCFHLSYGMVDLPDGKMKSREGRVVDADDLMEEVVEMATESTQERGQIEGLNQNEKEKLYEMIGMGGLKYFLLKVDPQKRMKFNPNESIDLNGNTGPFIQYAYARIQSLLAKTKMETSTAEIALLPPEIELIKHLNEFPSVVREAGTQFSPAIIANYTYDLVKDYNSFYQSNSVMKEDNIALKNARILISQNVGKVIQTAFGLLGIEVPERM